MSTRDEMKAVVEELEAMQASQCRIAATREKERKRFVAEHQRQMKVLRRKTWAACIMALLASAGWWAWVAKATTEDVLASTEQPAERLDDFAPADETLSDADAGADVIGKPMPVEPMKGQKKPPCAKDEAEIRGGCWMELVRKPEDDHCGGKGFEHEGTCYTPVRQVNRPPTSVEP